MAKAKKRPVQTSGLPPKPAQMPPENIAVKKLLWSGLVAGVGVAAVAAAERAAHAIWVKVFDEEPPTD
jgi:hypothetical protein